MMTIEEALVARLRREDAVVAVIGSQDSIYPGFVPEEETGQTIAYELVAPPDHVMTQSGPAGIATSRLRVWCFSDKVDQGGSAASAKTLAVLVHEALEAGVPTWWGNVAVAYVDCSPGAAVFSVELQRWSCPVEVQVNHNV